MSVENPKESTKKPLGLISEFSKVLRYKINMQKPMVFLHTNHDLTNSEIKNTVPFIIIKKYEPLRCKSLQTCTGFVCQKLQNADAIDQRKSTQMERHLTFKNLKTT